MKPEHLVRLLPDIFNGPPPAYSDEVVVVEWGRQHPPEIRVGVVHNGRLNGFYTSNAVRWAPLPDVFVETQAARAAAIQDKTDDERNGELNTPAPLEVHDDLDAQFDDPYTEADDDLKNAAPAAKHQMESMMAIVREPESTPPGGMLSSLFNTARERAVEGAKHGAAYSVARAVTERTLDRLQGNTMLTAMLVGLPEPVRVFLVCNIVQALARSFGGEHAKKVSSVVEHGMEGASTVLFAKIDLQSFFKEISNIDIDPGSEGVEAAPMGSSKNKPAPKVHRAPAPRG